MQVFDPARPHSSLRRVAIGFSAVVAVPALLWLDTLIALARGWRLPWHLLPVVFAVPVILLVIVTVVPAVALLVPRAAAGYARRAPHLTVACLTFISAVLAANLAVNLEFDRWAWFHRRPPNTHIVFHS
jgi:hypothetical protein